MIVFFHARQLVLENERLTRVSCVAQQFSVPVSASASAAGETGWRSRQDAPQDRNHQSPLDNGTNH